MIPYGRQSVDEADIVAVVEVLRSDWLTQGPTIELFERALSDYTGARRAVALSSGTGALHLACLALGLGPGDLLWTSPITFVASANCARYCGADVDFVDIDPDTYNMSVEALAAKLEAAQRDGRLPKVVVPVHMTGQPCDMAGIADLAARYGFTVVEDASHAIGASYLNTRIGGCAYSTMTVLSFHPVKMVTTGEGGAVLTNDDALADKVAMLRTHGITRDPALMQGEPDGGWYYQQLELGFNYRMTDIQAALGVSQMTRIGDFLQRRREIAARYDAELAALPLTLPWQHPDGASAWHLYVIRVRPDAARSRREVYDSLRAAGIGVNVHYIPVHLQPYYRDLGFSPGDFPVAEAYYSEAISLPIFPAMTEAEQDAVSAAVREALR
jgi:UDP-4-amino-4,6-dideoxy-N-acetyl-beta-L-altrosamine transaminase